MSDHDIDRSKYLLDIARRLREGDLSRPLAEAALLVGGFTDELVARVLADSDPKPEPFNINRRVWFVLSEHGANIMNRSIGLDVDDAKAGEMINKHLWRVMEIFGPATSWGAAPCFDGNKIWFEDPEAPAKDSPEALVARIDKDIYEPGYPRAMLIQDIEKLRAENAALRASTAEPDPTPPDLVHMIRDRQPVRMFGRPFVLTHAVLDDVEPGHPASVFVAPVQPASVTLKALELRLAHPVIPQPKAEPEPLRGRSTHDGREGVPEPLTEQESRTYAAVDAFHEWRPSWLDRWAPAASADGAGVMVRDRSGMVVGLDDMLLRAFAAGAESTASETTNDR